MEITQSPKLRALVLPSERESSIYYLKILSYTFFTYLTLWYSSYISFLQGVVLLLSMPSEWVMLYFIYSNNIAFSGIRWLLFSILLLFVFFQVIENVKAYSRGLTDVENEINAQMNLLNQQAMPMNVQSAMCSTFSYVKFNLEQLLTHKETLENDLNQLQIAVS